jgi:hypothetical protein
MNAYQIPSGAWRVGRVYASKMALPIDGEARDLYHADYPDEPAAWRAIDRIRALSLTSPEQFIAHDNGPVTVTWRRRKAR